MISIIEKISFKNSDELDAIWYDLDMIPATGELETSTKTSVSGRIKTTKLKVMVKTLHPHIYDNLQIRIYATNKELLELGTVDVPVVFEVEDKEVIEISFEYKSKA